MAKGYWIAHLTINDPERFKQYQAANAAPLSAHGARFLVRGGAFVDNSGTARKRHVVVEFPSFAAAKACFESAEYQAAYKILKEAAEVDHLMLEGYEG
ncbi:MAG: DUF1330 domain-containing protein [Hyphomicrobiales bacterium]|nr:DUF1330 domain-containing protein [Hyphomicrobiales bacterium]